jgi:hypothetical protein
MAHADNRSSAVSYTPDAEQIAADVGAGIDLGDWWHQSELDQMQLPDEWQEYDESIADEVEFHECPECGHEWPK